MNSDEDDEVQEQGPCVPSIEDEAQMFEGLRAHFPLSFGRQEPKKASLEAIHSATKRPEISQKLKDRFHKAGSYTHRSSSQCESEKCVKPVQGPLPLGSLEPLRPPETLTARFEPNLPSDEENVMVGPPLPPKNTLNESDGEDIGPGAVEGANLSSTDDEDGDTDGDDEEEVFYQVPASNEIILKGHTKIYDRDGLTLGEFLRGDMYIRDLKNTQGHISGLTGGEWHPKEKQTILTSSEDGSLRIWDVTDFKTQKQVIKPKLARPGRVAVTACAWGLDGKCLAGGLGNGSLQIWNMKAGWGSRPDIYIERAHADGDDVSGVKFASDGYTLLSRSLDATLKVWDLRSTKAAVKVFENLPNSYQQTNVALSPDEQLILTGTSAERGGSAGGILYLFDRMRLELVRKIGVSSHSVVSCFWHKRLNQILATSGDKKEGGTHILYDPALSERGALICVARAPRKKSAEDFEARPVIHHPHALPLFRDEPSRKRQREKARNDPVKSKRPDLPVTGPGFGGRVGTTKGSLLTQYLLKEGGLIKETWMEEDPREAILKYADAAAKDPKYIAPAYAETQPKTIFASSDSEEEK